MDPRANVEEQRNLAREIVEREDVDADVARLAELALALDEWRSGGGFDPYTTVPGGTYAS